MAYGTWFNMPGVLSAGQAGGPYELVWKNINGGGTFWYGTNGSGVVTGTIATGGGLLMGIIPFGQANAAAATLTDVSGTYTKTWGSADLAQAFHPTWLEFDGALTFTTGSSQFFGFLIGTKARPPFQW